MGDVPVLRWSRCLRVTIATLALAAAAGCVEDRGPVAEVGQIGAVREVEPPPWPAEGPASTETLTAGVLYDVSVTPDSADFYVPTKAEAGCVAERVAGDATTADRLNELGYRPDRPGGRLTELEWTPAEREALAETFAECVDLEDAFAKVLVGDFRFDTTSASCVSAGLARRGVLTDLASAWAERRELDLMADDARIARELVRQSEVCLGRFEFILPEQDQTAIRPQASAPAVPGGGED